MTQKEILSVLNPENSRLQHLRYDQYLVTLKSNQRVVGAFDHASVTMPSSENKWKFWLKPNPINHVFESQDYLTIDGEDILFLDRL